MSKFVSTYRIKHDRCNLPTRSKDIDEETANLIDIDLRNLHKEKKKRMMVFTAKERKTKKTTVIAIQLPSRNLKAGGVIKSAVRQYLKQGCRLKEAQKIVMSLIEKHNKNSEQYKRYL